MLEHKLPLIVTIVVFQELVSSDPWGGPCRTVYVSRQLHRDLGQVGDVLAAPEVCLLT